MSFRHVVMFKWEDHVDEAHVEQVHAGLAALPDDIDVIRSYVHGPDLGVSEGTYDYVVIADFDDLDDFLTYRHHPLHVQLIDDLIAGHVADRASVQYRTDLD